jgi:4'-phosphopantetheinyl transferase EntD
MTDLPFPTSLDPKAPLRALLPLTVATHEHWGGALDLELTRDEMNAVERSVDSRRREFATGRYCARAALRHFGVTEVSIVANPDRTPAWPDGFVGSITHTQGYCGAAVAPAALWVSIGVDAERDDALDRELWPDICLPEELAWLDAQSVGSRVAMATIFFCAKEAFYKCQYPISRRWLDFHSISVEIKNQSFVVSFRTPLDIDGFRSPLRGRFVQRGGIVVTAIAVPRHQTLVEFDSDGRKP